ncbi:SRPBCC family protein [Streptomyces sp. NPDC046985]|uniref:SRPBCC family protein n=1 Tax=Streptomyces sp. NPDC046985 TaxID=3155377 RepID=UPI0033CD4E3E
MVDFLIERTAPLPLDEVWRRLTDWPRHADVAPLTGIRMDTPGPTRVGTRFTARTALGPLGFDDPMEVTEWRPPVGGEPGRCRLEKRGRVMLGWAVIEVRPGPGGRTHVRWLEELRVRLLPSVCDPVLERTAREAYGRAVNKLLRRA